MTSRTSTQCTLSQLQHMAVTMILVAVALTSQASLAQSGYQDSESFRSDLLVVLELQKSLQQKYPEQSIANDLSLALIEKAINEAREFTTDELQVFQSINFSFRPAIESLQNLDSAMQAAIDQIESVQMTASSAANFGCDGYVERSGELVDPPGPCAQVNYDPYGSVADAATLTDNDYPTYGTCQQYQPFGLIAFSRAATIANEIIADVSRRLCDQIYTIGGVGANVALACIATDTLYLVQKGIRDTIANCQTARILSEGTTNYVREGELFIQSKQNTNTISRRAQEGFSDSRNGLREIRSQVDENAEKIEETITTLNEIMRALEIENSRLLNDGNN